MTDWIWLRIKCKDCGAEYNYKVNEGFYGDLRCKDCNSIIRKQPEDITQLLYNVRNWLLENGYDGVAKEFERDFRR